MKPKTITITIRMIDNWVEELKKTARNRAYKENRDISYQDLIKEAVYEKYFEKK